MEVIAFETGLSEEAIEEGLRSFEASGKVAYDFETSYVWVRKLLHDNASYTGSVKIRRHLERLMEDLSDACPYKAAWLEKHGKPCRWGGKAGPTRTGAGGAWKPYR